MLKSSLKLVCVLFVLMFSMALGSTSWGAGEYLSFGDREFLARLKADYPGIESLGGGVVFSVNGVQYGVNRTILGSESEYFRNLFTSGFQETRVSRPDASGRQIVDMRPLEISGIHEDQFAKILRLVIEKIFEPFDAAQDQDGALTTEFIRNLAFYGLTQYFPKVLEFQVVRDESTLVRAMKILSVNEEIQGFAEVSEDLSLKIRAYAQTHRSSRRSVLSDVLSCLGVDFLCQNIPGLRVVCSLPVRATQPAVICPAGYIPVPGNPVYVERAFCVMKYEASQGEGARAMSVTGALPWVQVDRPRAREACRANGPGYDLLTNAQWMTIARNIEENTQNWNQGNGPAGTGALSRGNSHSTSALAAAGDENPYFGLPAIQQGDWYYNRTHVLSNEEVIWDMAGNVSEWVLDDLGTNRHGWLEYSSRHFSQASTEGLRFLYGPAGAFDATQNTGKIYMDDAGAVRRGGDWDSAEYGGVFAADLGSSARVLSTTIGFRCAFQPETVN